MNNDKMAFSIDEAAKACSMGRVKLYQEINAGRLKIRKCGSRTLVLRKDLEDFLNNLEIDDMGLAPTKTKS